MNWVAWRQHRKQFLVVGILLVLYAALLIPTGIHFWHAYQQTLSNCAQNPATPSCSDVGGNLFQTNIDQILFHLVPLTVVLIPLILGVFWGAPLLSKEYTEGTNILAWTQSVSRRKWLTIKLLWVLFATVILVGAFAALDTWWSKTPNTINMSRFNSGLMFDSQGIVPAALGLFAVSYGIMFGAWFRKIMIAVGLTLGVFIAVAIIIVPNFVRSHYMSPISVTAPMGPGTLETKIPNDAWATSRNIVDKNGQSFNSFNLANMPQQCQQIIQQSQVGTNGHGMHVKASPTPGGGDPIDTCLNNAGYHQVATYQPSYRYWDFQRIEAGLYLAISALPIAATYWLVVKRDA
jgi:ABC-type transport system involved in multi-copper enzyme maturation permease subunit